MILGNAGPGGMGAMVSSRSFDGIVVIMTTLSGAHVLVVGATGGLGQAMARTFAARGATLILTGRRAEVLEPLAAELPARVIAVDLSDPAAVDRLIGEIAIPIDDIAAGAVGKAELRGAGWNARNGHHGPLHKGQRCRVQNVDELMLILTPE